MAMVLTQSLIEISTKIYLRSAARAAGKVDNLIVICELLVWLYITFFNFRDVMPCSVVEIYVVFAGMYCLNLQVRKVIKESTSALNIEAANPSETSEIFYNSILYNMTAMRYNFQMSWLLGHEA
jgi:hypothetical protein